MLNKYPQFTTAKVIPQPNTCFIYSKENNVYDIVNFESLIFLQYLTGAISGVSIIQKVRETFPNSDESLIQSDYSKLINYLLQRGHVLLLEKPSSYKPPFEFVEQAEELKPVFADIELTRNCNLSCIYCYASAHRKHVEDDIPLEKWVNVLTLLYGQGLRAMKVSGGEPFLYPYFKEFLEFCSKKFIISLNTNGSFIDEKKAEWLTELNLQDVQVSIDSLTPEIHDKFRGKGSWEKAYNAAKLFHKYKTPSRISCTISAENKHEIENIKKMADELEAEYSFEVMTPVGRAQNIDDSCFIVNECEVTMHKSVLKAYQLLDFLDIKCQAQIGFIGISAKGNVKPCNLPEEFFENLGIPAVDQIEDKFKYSISKTYTVIDEFCRKVAAPKPKSESRSYDKCILYHSI